MQRLFGSRPMSSESLPQRPSTAGSVFLPMLALAILFLIFLARAAATYDPAPAIPEIAQPAEASTTASLTPREQVSLQ